MWSYMWQECEVKTILADDLILAVTHRYTDAENFQTDI